MHVPTGKDVEAAHELKYGRAYYTAVLVNEMFMAIKRTSPKKEQPILTAQTPFGMFEVKDIRGDGDWLIALEVVQPNKNAILYFSVEQCSFKFESQGAVRNVIEGFKQPASKTTS
ncbi:MAG: hypothetical protein ABSA83_20395 [Verrucomicrobiota bacterium]|jgi:hypothetical protein